MRNYVIINGENSLDIQGLAINTLPPITKPMIRTRTEEIDGRDGDIITELGYSAYDKSMEIGLYGNFDIDAIIKYFTGEGTITFSNEEDKYYNFKIVNQIDYEKLLKFKTAVVTFHCQPFKYPIEEEPVEAEMVTLTGTGESITLEDTQVGKMKVDLKGNTQQNGTPTPDTPIDIQVVSGDNTIKVEGKNLFDKNRTINSTYTSSIATALSNFKTTGKYATGYFDNGTTISNNASFITSFTPCQSGITYTMKNTYPGTFSMVGFIDENGNVINHNSSWSTDKYTHTATSEEKYIICGINTNANGIDYRNYVQIEKGNQATTYTPYVSQTYPISLGNIELCKIGTYQDSIVKDNGKWYLNKQIGKTTVSSFASKSGTTRNNDYFTSAISGILRPSGGNILIPTYSNHFTQDTADNVYSYDRVGLGVNTNGTLAVGFGLSSSITTLELANQWITNNNILLYFPLATPTYTEITDTTLLSQLEALAYSYEGTTNISQVNDDLAFELDISLAFLKPIEVNNIGNIYSKPILTIEGSGNIGVILNDIQILQIALGEGGKITIDVPNLEAYNPDNNLLMNRLVTGDYMKLLINEGDNEISFDGDVSGATLTNYVRWI